MKIFFTTPIMYLSMLPVDDKVRVGLEKLKDGLEKFRSFVQMMKSFLSYHIHIFMSIRSSHVICIFTFKV